MLKKLKTAGVIDYIALMTIFLIQPLFIYFSTDFIEYAFGTARFMPIIIPLLATITYSLYFGNSKLSFTAGFLLTISPQIYFIFSDFPQSIYFILNFPQSMMASIIIGVVFGLVGVLFSMTKKNSGIITRISINIAVLISVLGIHIIFGQSNDIGFWLSFNSALMIGLSLSYYTLHDVKKAFVFTFLALITIFLIIIKSPLNIIFLYRTLPENLFIGIIIAIILGIILKVYTYYRAHKTQG